MVEYKVTEQDYIDLVRETIEKEGWRIADAFNKKALESKTISTELYSRAARYIAEALLMER